MELITVLKNALDAKHADDALHFIANTLVPFAHTEAMRLSGGVKIFDNYNYRQMQMFGIMKSRWPHVVLSSKRTGKDAWSTAAPVLDNIEMKSMSNDPTSNPLTVAFPFDKQNDPQRRRETLEYDGFAFSVLYDERVRILLLADHADTVTHMHGLLEAKQGEFVEKWDANIAAGKRGGHDAIRVSFKDMFSAPATIWHLWMDDVWHYDISSEGCLAEFQKFQHAIEPPSEPKKARAPRAPRSTSRAPSRAPSRAKKATTSNMTLALAPPTAQPPSEDSEY